MSITPTGMFYIPYLLSVPPTTSFSSILLVERSCADCSPLLRTLQFLNTYKLELGSSISPSLAGVGFTVNATRDVVDRVAGTRDLQLEISHPGLMWTSKPIRHPIRSHLPNYLVLTCKLSLSMPMCSSGAWMIIRRRNTFGTISNKRPSLARISGRLTCCSAFGTSRTWTHGCPSTSSVLRKPRCGRVRNLGRRRVGWRWNSLKSWMRGSRSTAEGLWTQLSMDNLQEL